MNGKIVHINKETYDVYIGRPSKWGNPFTHLDKSAGIFKVNTRKESIDRYREWILTQPDLMTALHELKGKTLGCFCKPKPCHGDVLVELANPNTKPKINLF